MRAGANFLHCWCTARLEERQNEENARELVGSRVLYGQSFQLLHVNSNKFVTVRPRQLARTEKDCVLLELDPEGSEHSQFTLHPRFKHYEEGDAVQLFNQVLLYSVTVSALHCMQLSFVTL